LVCRYGAVTANKRRRYEREYNSRFCEKLESKQKAYEIWDTELKGFIVRVQPSGLKTFLVEYARHKRVPIGQAAAISAAEARKRLEKDCRFH